MERCAWKAIVRDGCLDEYVRRHDAIWPELKQLLKDAGISTRFRTEKFSEKCFIP